VIAEAGSGVATEGHVPFAPRSKKVLEITFREALDLGHNYIGTEHLVLALAREKKGAAGKLLAERSITPKALRERIVQILIGLQQAAAPGGAVAPSVASEGRLYGRLTQRARAVLARSERAARAHGQSDVGAEHLLLGLFDLPDIAARILAKRFDLDRGSIEEAILERVPRGTGSPDGELPFTPGAKRTLDAAIKEAMKLGETFAGTEHLLLALASGDGVARDVLDKFAASYEEVKQGVQAALVDEL
jgi:ATP-dependent Clp protease ATP-binding subunit ClpA